MAQVTITARPLAPPTPSGKPGAYGLWEARVHLPNGSTVWGGGLGEAEARANASRRAAREWGEVEALLTEVEQEAAALEAGDLDLHD